LLLVRVTSSQFSIDFLDDFDLVGGNAASFSFQVEFRNLENFADFAVLVPPLLEPVSDTMSLE
jgi:hypothetical protein